MSQNIQQLEQDLRDAQHKAAAAKAKLTAPDTAVTEAMNRLEAAREQVNREQFQQDIAESDRLGQISIAASRELVAAIARHDIDNVLKIYRDAAKCFDRLSTHNWAICGLDTRTFDRLNWGIAPGLAICDAMKNTDGEEALIRAGIIFVLQDGQRDGRAGKDARFWNLPGDVIEATRRGEKDRIFSRSLPPGSGQKA